MKIYLELQTEQTDRDEQSKHYFGHFTHTVTLFSKYPSIGMHLEEFESNILKSSLAEQLRQDPVLLQA